MSFDRSNLVLDDWLIAVSRITPTISGTKNVEIKDILLDDWKVHTSNELDSNYWVYQNNELGEFQKHIEKIISNILLLWLSSKFSQEDMDSYLKEQFMESNYLEWLYNQIDNIFTTAYNFKEKGIVYNKSNIHLFFTLIRIQLITRWRADYIENISDKILEIDCILEGCDFKNYSKYMLTGNLDFLID